MILHTAVSLDGRIDWFSPDTGLFYELAGVFKEAASLVGCDTMLKAGEGHTDAEVIVIETRSTNPLLVVPDSRGRIRNWRYWQAQPYWRGVLVLCSQTTPQGYLKYLRETGTEYLIAGTDHVDFRTALEALDSHYGVTTVRVDSGGTLNGVLLRVGLADEVSVLIHLAW